MILRLRYTPTTQQFSVDPCPGIVVNRARSFSSGDVEIDFDFMAVQDSKPWMPTLTEEVDVPEKKAKRSR
jgi:hypothetical protein